MFSMHPIKRLVGLWRTATVRLAIVFAAIFGIGAVALLAMIDFGVTRFAEDEIHDALMHQMAIMRADVKLEGGEALTRVLAQHVRTDTISRYRYLVIPVQGKPFNSGIPHDVARMRGFHRIDVPASDAAMLGKPKETGTIGMLVLAEQLQDGTFMAVGREQYPLEELRSLLNRIAIWGSLGLIIFSMIASVVAGILFLRRLERVNETTGRIIEGNLSERIPSIGFGQEFRDLTQNLNTMLDRLETVMTAMREMSSNLAHDLRMPLARLRNRLEELQPTSDAQDAQIESAIEEADELLSLFNSMLRIARLKSGSIHHEMAELDLAELVKRAVEAYQPAAEDSGRRLAAKTAGGTKLFGDPALLSQMIANLIDNGLRHTPPGTVIEVSVSIEADAILLMVADNGQGVSEKDIPKLTERFYRVDQSRTGAGAGLGLTLVATIVEIHRATMAIVNRYPGLCVEIRFKVS